jgi:general secretion pathway protein K
MMRRQRGATVLVALVTVALVAVVAARLLSEQDHWHRQVLLQTDRMQATALAQAGVRYAMAILADDMRAGDTDHGREAWARPLPPMSAEGGSLAGRITDLQGRLNLNDAGHLPGEEGYAADQPLPRLFAALALSPALLAALSDWVDADDAVRASGAEDAYYLSLPRPYRAANRPLASIEELRFVRGFDAAIIARLRPYVTALPPGTPINLNTAPAEVMLAGIPGLSESQATALRESSDRRPFASVADFVERAQSFGASVAPTATLAVSSRWFEIVGDVQWGWAFARMQVIVERREAGRMPRIVTSTVQ